MNFASEEAVYRALAAQQNLAYAELDGLFVPEAVMRKVLEGGPPVAMATANRE